MLSVLAIDRGWTAPSLRVTLLSQGRPLALAAVAASTVNANYSSLL